MSTRARRGKSRRFAANVGLALVFGALCRCVVPGGAARDHGVGADTDRGRARRERAAARGARRPAAHRGAVASPRGRRRSAAAGGRATRPRAAPVDEHGVRRLLARALRSRSRPSRAVAHLVAPSSPTTGSFTTGRSRSVPVTPASSSLSRSSRRCFRTSLQNGARDALLGATRVALDGNAPIRQKVPIALDLRNALAKTPKGKVPDLAAPFDKRGAATDPNLRQVRDELIGALPGRVDPELPIVVRALRAARGARARADPRGSQEGGRMTTRRGTLALRRAGRGRGRVDRARAPRSVPFRSASLISPTLARRSPRFRAGASTAPRSGSRSRRSPARRASSTRPAREDSSSPSCPMPAPRGSTGIKRRSTRRSRPASIALRRTPRAAGLRGRRSPTHCVSLVAPSIAWFLGTANGT